MLHNQNYFILRILLVNIITHLYISDFPTCLLCTCISTTVYCDDHELDAIPPLPKKTAYFYSRFNRIKKINQNDFASLSMDILLAELIPITFLFIFVISVYSWFIWVNHIQARLATDISFSTRWLKKDWSDIKFNYGDWWRCIPQAAPSARACPTWQ